MYHLDADLETYAEAIKCTWKAHLPASPDSPSPGQPAVTQSSGEATRESTFTKQAQTYPRVPPLPPV